MTALDDEELLAVLLLLLLLEPGEDEDEELGVAVFKPVLLDRGLGCCCLTLGAECAAKRRFLVPPLNMAFTSSQAWTICAVARVVGSLDLLSSSSGLNVGQGEDDRLTSSGGSPQSFK